jgi:hypothetical protein
MPKRSYTKADKIHALKVIELCKGNLSAASRELVIPRKTLAEWVADKETAGEQEMANNSPLADDLTLKQARFADGFAKTGNATDAARKAGYEADVDSLAVIGSQN